MSYERGKAPSDAPIVWDRLERPSWVATLKWPSGAWTFHDLSDADTICRAFHLAALAREAEPTVRMFGSDASGFRKDWLRRYDAAKGDA